MPQSRSLRSTARLTFAGLLLAATMIPTVRGSSPAAKRYYARCAVTHLVKGESKLFCNPNLQIIGGQEGSFLNGGEIKVGADPAPQWAEVGERLIIKVKDIGEGNVNVSAKFAEIAPIKRDNGGVVLHESSVHLLQAVKIDEPLTLTMDNGSAVKITIVEADPRPR